MSTTAHGNVLLDAKTQALWQETYDAAFADTSDERLAELAAWGAIRRRHVMRLLGRKSPAGNPVITGWAMLFTDEGARDVDNQYFDAATDTLLDFYKGAPLWYEHGQDATYGITPIGRRVNARVYRRGVVLEHELLPDHPLFERTMREIEAGDLTYSTDTLSHYAREGYDDESGYLGVWFAAGCSVTRNPAEPALGAVTEGEFITAMKRAAAEAREAQGGTINDGLTNKTMETSRMKEKMLKQLAVFFGVEATLAAVKMATEDVIAAMTEEDTDEEDAGEAKDGMPDMAQLRAALQLPEDADATVIREALMALIATMEAPVDAAAVVEGGMSAAKMSRLNYGALGAAWSEAAKSAPALGGAPLLTKKHDAPGKSRTYGGGVFGGTIKSSKPSLIKTINDIASGKAASSQIGSTGGYILNMEVSDQIIPELLERNWLMEAGVTQYPMDGTAALTIPKDEGGVAAYWVGEAQEVGDTEASFGTVTLMPKAVAARIAIPNQLLNNSRIDYEANVRAQIVYRINRAIENAALFGTGGVVAGSTGAQPRGLVNTTGVTITSLGTNGAQPTLEDLTAAELRLQEADVEASESWRWVFSPRTKKTFTDLTDSDGSPLLRQTWRDGAPSTLIGYPYQATTLVPNNLTVGTSTDCSIIFLGEWKHFAVGISNQIEIAVNPYRLMHQLMTEIIAYTYVDVAVLQAGAFEVLTGVRT